MPTLPVQFCNQVSYIWIDTIGEYTRPRRLGFIDRAYWDAGDQPASNFVWQELYQKLEREKGLPPLTNKDKDRLKLFTEYITHTEIEDALYAIEITFQLIDTLRPSIEILLYKAIVEKMKITADKAIEGLNKRFRQHGLGYQYNNGSIIKTD